MWRLLYNLIAFPVIWMGSKLIALKNLKFRQSIRGRVGWQGRLEQAVKKFRNGYPVIWMHAASMGEFEHAIPIIGELKSRFRNSYLVMTFFSPSAYNHIRSFPGVDVIDYLPFDSTREVHQFYRILNPTVGLIVKHDTWPNLCWLAHDRNLPLFLVDASLPENSKRLRAVSFTRSVYRAFHEILSVSPDDAKRFERLVPDKSRIKVLGDTRYDQVYFRSQKAGEQKIIPSRVYQGKKIIIAGSNWPEDDQHLLPALLELMEKHKNLVGILVPHEVDEGHYQGIEKVMKSVIRLSAIQKYRNERTVLVDRVGILAGLYSVGHIAYVGGAFSTGVHSVMEPAVFGLPIFTGPRIHNSHEARELVSQGAAFVIRDRWDLFKHWDHLLSNETQRSRIGKLSSDFIKQNLGATKRLVDHLEPLIKKKL